MPLRFDKVCVYPGHKDHLALVRSSTVRIVSITKSFETYITKLQRGSRRRDSGVSMLFNPAESPEAVLDACRHGFGGLGLLLDIFRAPQPT